MLVRNLDSLILFQKFMQSISSSLNANNLIYQIAKLEPMSIAQHSKNKQGHTDLAPPSLNGIIIGIMPSSSEVQLYCSTKIVIATSDHIQKRVKVNRICRHHVGGGFF